MSEQPAQAALPVFSIEKIYLKDLSLEIPNAPQVFSEREAPKIDVNIHNAAGPDQPGRLRSRAHRDHHREDTAIRPCSSSR